MSAREARLTALAATIQADPAREWTTGDVHALWAGAAPKNRTARRGLATLHTRGLIAAHTDTDGRRYYTSNRSTR